MPKKETISIRILKLLNLESEFEMSYEEYSRNLKEALAAARLLKSKFSSEEAELLLKEYKRIRNKKGRFTINPKKESVNTGPEPKVNKKKAIAFLTGSKEKPIKTESKSKAPSYTNKEEKTKNKSISLLQKISSTIDKIHKNVLTLNKILTSSNEKDRRQQVRSRRKAQETRLESKVFDGFIKATKEILKPFKSIFDRILQFLVFTFLGRLFTMFSDWAGNPENEKKVNNLFRFLKDFAPALTTAAFLFLTPFGAFIGSVIKIAGGMTKRLLTLIPKLLLFAKRHPIATAVVLTALSAGKLFLDSKGAGEKAIEEEKKKLGRELTAEEETKVIQDKFLSNPILNPIANFMIPTLTDQVTADDKPEDEKNIGDRTLDFGGGIFDSINQFLPDFSGIFTGEFNKGGIFSGIVDKNTGTSVSGFGKDTQFLPMADGKSGVVVQPGEIVMNKEQQKKLAADTGIDPREYVPGPKKGKLQKFASGGMIGSNPNYETAYKTIGSNFPSAKPHHIAGALGNFETEAPGLKPNTYQIGGGPGRGIAQWEIDHSGNNYMGRWPKAEEMYGKGVINSLKDQLNFMKWEMETGHPLPDGRPNLPYGRATKDTWLGSPNLRSATLNFMKAYEAPGIPHTNRRLANAKKFLDLSKNFGSKKQMVSSPSLQSSSSSQKKDIFEPFKTAYKNYESFRDSEDGQMLQSLIKNIFGFKGGGKVKEGTGMNIPGATDDRQLVSLRVQPGEYLKVFTKDFVDKGGMDIMNQLQSRLDSDSNARKSGIKPLDMNRYIPESPSTSNGGIQIINLPSEVISSGAPNIAKKPQETVPSFEAVSSSSINNRMAIATIYGMME